MPYFVVFVITCIQIINYEFGNSYKLLNYKFNNFKWISPN